MSEHTKWKLAARHGYITAEFAAPGEERTKRRLIIAEVRSLIPGTERGGHGVAGDWHTGLPRGDAEDLARLLAEAPAMKAALETTLKFIDSLGHEAICNGVHSPDGQCEGSWLTSRFSDEILSILARIEGHDGSARKS